MAIKVLYSSNLRLGLVSFICVCCIGLTKRCRMVGKDTSSFNSYDIGNNIISPGLSPEKCWLFIESAFNSKE